MIVIGLLPACKSVTRKHQSLSYQERDLNTHFANNDKPKRILALDGGGLRGILTVAFLQKIEDILRQRHGNSEDFRLCHYFDLIVGTSTGVIIATALAQGWTVEQVRRKYMTLGSKVFRKDLHVRKSLPPTDY